MSGDTCDILLSGPRRSKKPGLYPKRKWVATKDTCIWTCGEVPHHPSNIAASLKYLERNYDAVCFGYVCPTKTKAYPDPLFLPFYTDLNLPKVAWVSDGHWEKYSFWVADVLDNLKALICPIESYAIPVRRSGFDRVEILKFPFVCEGNRTSRSESPLLVWPNQWKPIKGLMPFLEQVPNIRGCAVEMYSCGVAYYQIRGETTYQNAIGKDLYKGFNGQGQATYFGNVDRPEIQNALRRAWFSCNLQGINTKHEAYSQGSYNNTEVESLWSGACPILHKSALKAGIPTDCCITVESAEELPEVITWGIKTGFATSPSRIERARQFVRENHSGQVIYQRIKDLLNG